MTGSPRLDPADRAELTRLLPPPGDPELPAYRHRLLKEVLLQQLTERRAATPRGRFAALVAPAAPVAAAALVVAIAGSMALTRHGAGRGTATARPAVAVAVAAGDPAGVGPLMERVAMVVGGKPRVPVGDGEFVYIKSKVAFLVFPGYGRGGSKEAGVDPQMLDEVHTREIWVPAAQGDEGLIRERGDTFGLHGAFPNSRFASLPADPDALLKKVYADTSGQGGGPDAEAFDFLGAALTESLLPPRVAAALYRAAAKIPGVVLVPDAVDAAGRHGVAVARTDDRGERREWIFDATTLEYLGERSYLVRDTATGKAGMLTGTTAVLQRGVVHNLGDLP